MVTGLYAGLLALMLLGLLTAVIRRRLKYKVGLGDGGIKDLEQAIRAHGNFVEVVPYVLILMFLLEAQGVQPWFLHLYGITLVVARLLHAWGLYTSPYRTFGRIVGILLCQILMFSGAILLIYKFMA